MDLAQWQRERVIRQESHLILSNLELNYAETLNGLDGIREVAEQAREALRKARMLAANGSAPSPVNPQASVYCEHCGESRYLHLSNHGDPDTEPEWYFCTDERACAANRAERYPDRPTEELRLAKAEVAQHQISEEAAVLALTAYHGARQGRPAQDTLLALSAPQKPAGSRPGGNFRPSWHARFNHAISARGYGYNGR